MGTKSNPNQRESVAPITSNHCLELEVTQLTIDGDIHTTTARMMYRGMYVEVGGIVLGGIIEQVQDIDAIKGPPESQELTGAPAVTGPPADHLLEQSSRVA
jgi:hypothetical protein